MRSSAEHGDSGHYGEGGVGHQAQPVQHHGCKLPVALHRPALLIIPDLVSDHLDLLEDETQLPVQRMVGASHCAFIRLGTARRTAKLMDVRVEVIVGFICERLHG